VSTDAVVLAMDALVGLSWGDPATRARYRSILAPWDTEAHREEMACAQSSCAVAICAALLIAEVDGIVRGWRGQIACDPLRAPRSGHYDAIMYLEHLSRQRGLYAAAAGREPPDVRAGVVLQVEGPDHVLMATNSPDAEGNFTTAEGGQSDPLNPRTGAQNCTAIRRRVRQLGGGPGAWSVDGRRVRWAADAGALPCCREGMPWDRVAS
jgi:hypothetical protein